MKLNGIREYAEGYPVELVTVKGRWAIQALNEGGYNCTQIDLLDLLEWAKNNPQLYAAEDGGKK